MVCILNIKFANDANTYLLRQKERGGDSTAGITACMIYFVNGSIYCDQKYFMFADIHRIA